ncbi:MAG: hypothetical protein U9N43_10185 [Euryarchaeota archaeon]|nr:hypothetical protein [Euryarchaeota archaeon]
MKMNRINIVCLAICVAFLILTCEPVSACDVPVFRYAMERWHVDIYEIVVFHDGSLNPEDTSTVSWLLQHSHENNPSANFLVTVVDLSTEMDGSMRGLWESLDSPGLPLLVVRQPESGMYRGCVWSSSLSMDSARKIVNSPARQEIAKRLMDGGAASFVLIAGSNQSHNNKAAKFVREELSMAEDELTLSPQFLERTDLEELGAKPTPEFSLIRLSRDDPAEEVFVSMLMYSEPGLFEYQEDPMLFPMFGRGRTLYALAGRGITRDNIYAACEVTIGPCSCTVKDGNPGVDMLIVADWNSRIGKSWIDEDIPLVGLGTMAGMGRDNESWNFNTVDLANAPNILQGNVIAVSIATVLIVMILSMLVVIRSEKKK